MESSTTTTSYAGQDQQGAAVNCGMVHGGSMTNGVCYHGSSNTGSGSANQIGDGDPLGDIVDTVVDGVNSATDWWESDPLNDQAEEVFDNLNTVVETVDEKIIGDGICSGLGQAITGEAGPGAGVAAWMTCSVRE